MARIGVPATHETAIRLDMMAAGFTRPERDAFMAVWEQADPQRKLAPAELMLLERFYGNSARDLGDAL